MVEFYPAIDLRGGRVVRLRQGDYAAETVYGDEPVAIAEAFVDAGARWVHVVDLDAARTGAAFNRAVIADIAAAVRGRARLQTGGGVRSLADVEALAAHGVSRAVMGSAALADPAVVVQASSVLPIAVGLDHRDGVLAVHGWTESSGVDVMEAFEMFPTAAAFVITDISRDGMLAGPDLDGLAAAAAATEVPVIASGGIGSLADVTAVATIAGVRGVIAGRAIYEGRLDVAAAVQALADTGTS